ncbi:MAG TPA: hypothetical protein VE686_08580 [Beijerinckiaceae bacterium]|nr:hypothetical protein [Beijerinckiaceae bacterium]
MLAGAMAAVLAAGAAQAAPWAFEQDDAYFRQPPLTLPEGINGVLRASARPTPVGGIETIGQVFAAVHACWHPPSTGPSGQQITLRLAFKRSGEIIGTPRITYYRAGGSEEDRNLFTRSVRQAFAACLPLPLSRPLGAAMAGRPFTFRFVDDRRT